MRLKDIRAAHPPSIGERALDDDRHTSAHGVAGVVERFGLDADALDALYLKATALKVLDIVSLMREAALPEDLKERIPYFGNHGLAGSDGQIELRQMPAA